MHCVVEPDWNTRYQEVKDVLSEAKEKGIIRAHGCSCHTLEALEAAAADPWVEVDLARYNPWGAYMDNKQGEPQENAPGHVKPILQKMRKAGKGVIGMKIVAQGDVAKGEDKMKRIRESLKFALADNVLNAMVVGLESPQQVAEIVTETRVALAERDGYLA
jgi:aryl-alcohol dehydrogenase-like predicted oxidoreductase